MSTRFWETLRRGDVIVRIVLCLAAAVIMAIVTRAWAPPQPYRAGFTPPRDMVARVDFAEEDRTAVVRAEEAARRQARHVYKNDPQLQKELRAALREDVAELLEAEDLGETTAQVWHKFLARPQPPPGPAVSPDVPQAAVSPPETSRETAPSDDGQRQQEAWRWQFEHFRFALSEDGRLQFDGAVERSFEHLEKYGLFEKRDDSDKQYPGNPLEIFIYRENQWDARQPVEVREVQITYAKPKLLERLRRELEPLEQDVAERLRRRARQNYVLDPQPLIDLRARLVDKLIALAGAAEFDEETAKLWEEFQPLAPGEPLEATAAEQRSPQEQFQQFRTALNAEDFLNRLDPALSTALQGYEQQGLLVELKTGEDVPEQNDQEIIVISGKDGSQRQVVPVDQVRLATTAPAARERLEKELKSLEIAEPIYTWLDRQLPTATTLRYRQAVPDEDAVPPARLADLAYRWLEERLPTTLQLDKQRTLAVQDQAAEGVNPRDHDKIYRAGEDLLAAAGQPLEEAALKRLRLENTALVAGLRPIDHIRRFAAVMGMYLAVYTLCGLFIFFRFPLLLADTRRFVSLLILALITVAASAVLSQWKAELIPLLLFGMTVAIAYNQEVALLLSAAVALVIVLSVGHGLADFVILSAATATAILMLRRVRSRVKLVYVGVASGAVALLTTIGVNSLGNQPLATPLLVDAALFGLWGVAAGFAMTGLLPFIENIFGMLTEISLLELGDVAHPLLQELIRRAPGTYNHSINVASMAEAAAESIGAQGLLVRVGAYFHDIGKMLKPQYFIENQAEGANRHESLVPAMSTLIIIAHVKDGADLARQHHLPQAIIDFIQQHHGTTLVEYFYRRASQDQQKDPDAADVDENTFRYPGPRPQTKEAGILMLADAIESASRVLVEPTPSRIESLVE
nr:HDIG domain-containing protein [Planctomycetales bacterium]NIM08257.1 HDIG domain-containing protein [Planctomycetales bacterium]NIN07750.1 HDIG domain-containing protein [Planctomycetales bacterium]NIN76870.1 HDIG domain-containing protein [Planctomycetales bacterium]NIO34069.1 HDIG domain-containing protein [Planctomycetales bacterium]